MKGSMDNKTGVEYQAKPEDIVEVGPENNGPASQKERLLTIGETRYENVSNSISNAKKAVSGWFTSGATKLGRLWKGGMSRVLAAPEAAVVGVKATGEKIGEEYGYAKDSVVAGGKFVGEKVGEGIKSVGDDWNRFDKYTSDKTEQFGKWIGGGAASVYESTTEGYNKAKNFTKEKAGIANNYIKDKAANLEAVGSLLKERTGEKLNSVKEGIAKNYNGVVEYGKDAIDTATLRAWYARDAFNNKMNAIKKSILERKAEIQAEKLQKTLSKLAQMDNVRQMSNNLEAQAA